MSPSRQRFVTLLLATTGAAASFAHANYELADPVQSVATVDANSILDRASDLLTDGQVIRARAMVQALQDSQLGASLSDDQSQRVWKLLAQAERTIQRTDRNDIAIQKAQHALGFDRLLDAERQAQTVLNSSKSTSEQIERAQAVTDQITIRRNQALPMVPSTLRSAIDAFNDGDYAHAKTIITRIGAMGLELDAPSRRKLSIYRTRISDLEQTRGETFGQATPSMGMLAPESGASSEWLISNAEEMLNQPVEVTGEDLTDLPEVEIIDGAPEGDAFIATEVQPEPEMDLVETARKFEAQTLLANANIAYEERRLNDAMASYSDLLANFGSYLTPEDRSVAGQRLNEIEVSLGIQGGPSAGGLDDPIQERSIILQRLTATYDNLTGQANEALASGDTASASGFIAQARLEVQRARDVMPEATYEQYIMDLDTLASNVAQREEQLRQSRLETEAAEREQRTFELEAQRLNERDERVLASLERVRALQSELKYEEALEIVENILFLDPGNPSGLLLKDIIEDTIVYRKFLGYERDKKLSYARESLDNHEAMIIPDFLMDYPDDWPQISFQRGSTLEYAESEVNRAVLTKLNETRMPVDFDNNSFEDVLGFIGTTADLDIDVDWESLADIGVDPDSPITLRLNNVTLEVLIDRVLAKASDPALPASWAVQDGILTISSDDILRQNTVLEIYDVRDLLFDVPEFDNAPDFNIQGGGGGAGGGGGQSPFSGSTGDPQIATQAEREDSISGLIRSSIDPLNWADTGGTTSSLTPLNGTFVITTTPRYHREIIGLLNKLRSQRAIQISVEARFMTVDQNFFEQIGFDVDAYFNANNTEYTTASFLDPSLLPSDYFGPDGQLLSNIPVNFDANGDGTIDGNDTIPVFGPGGNGGTLPDGTTVPEDQWSIIRGAQNSFGLTESLAGAGGFANTILGLSPALGVTARFLDDVQVDFFIEATQADQRTTQLTAPRLTFMNGQRANISVTNSQTYVSDLTPITGSSSAAFDPTIDVIQGGVGLDVTGTVSGDRRYVTMTVQTTIQTVAFAAQQQTFTGAAGGGGNVGGDAGSFSGSVQLPITDTTQINTTVTVPDQGTILLGGQRLVEEVEVETGVPVLSKIPILSRFFSNRIDAKEESTLLVLIKPTILIQNEEEERHFPGLLDQLGG